MLVSELDLHQRHVSLLLLFGQSLLFCQTKRRVHRAHRLPAGFCPALFLYGGLRRPRVLLQHTAAGAWCCRRGNRGGWWAGLPSSSSLSLLLPLSMSVAQPLVSVDHGAPAVLITGRTETPQWDLSPAQFFYVNCHWAIAGRHLLHSGVVRPTAAVEANLAAVSNSELHPSSDAVIQLLLSFLAPVPDVVLNVSEQSRVQRSPHPLRQLPAATPTAPVAAVARRSRARSVLPPRLLASVQVGLVTAGASGQAIVTQEVGGSANPLAHTQKAPVHLEHTFIEQLVQDGLAKSCVLDAAYRVNAVVVIPVQKTQPHLVLEVVVCDVDGWF